METLEQLIRTVKFYVDSFGIPVGEQVVPLKVIALLGAGAFLTVRLGFVQLRRLGHGFAVTSGRYDDPDDPGDVSHFQALTTALSATVGIGNIAGAAWAIHYGGPGALFWMWMTALLGAATKFSEVTLAQRYRDVHPEAHKHEGTVAGGPMYYIERGMGERWRWMAVFFAIALGFTAFITGNAVQANTLADTLESNFGTPQRRDRPARGGGGGRGHPRRHHPHREGDRDSRPPDGEHLRLRRPPHHRDERRRGAAHVRPDPAGGVQPDGGGWRARASASCW